MARGRQFTDEDREQAQARREARRASLQAAQQRNKIVVGQYAIQRADERNWEIVDAKEEGRERFYPNIVWALQDLLALKIGDGAKRDIAGVLAAVRKASDEITTALKGNELELT